MYTVRNFKTKKALKEAVAAFNASIADSSLRPEALAVRFYQPGPFGGNEPKDGTISLEGPHYPAPHSWYASAVVKDGIVIKVK